MAYSIEHRSLAKQVQVEFYPLEDFQCFSFIRDAQEYVLTTCTDYMYILTTCTDYMYVLTTCTYYYILQITLDLLHFQQGQEFS